MAIKPKPAAPKGQDPLILEQRLTLPAGYVFAGLQARVDEKEWLPILQVLPTTYVDAQTGEIVLPAAGMGTPRVYEFRIGPTDGNATGAVFKILKPFPKPVPPGTPGTGGGTPPSPATLTGVAITPASVNEGTTQAFTATGSYSSGPDKDLSTQGAWSVPGYTFVANVLTIPANTAVGDGKTVVVTFTYLGKAYTQAVTIVDKTVVTPPPVTLVSVALSPASQDEGTTVAYTATATYSDTSTKDVSLLGAWSTPGYTFSANQLTIPANSVSGDGKTITVTFTYLGQAYPATVTVVDKTVVVTPPLVLVTGQLPFSPTYLSQTGTLPSNKLKNLFQEDVTNEAIENYVTSSTATTDVSVNYPASFFLDNVVLYDGGDTAANQGTQPLQLFYQAKGSAALTKLGEFDGALFNVDLPPLVPTGGRVEITRLVVRMTGSRAVWPRRIRVNGAFPQGYAPPAYQRKGSSLADQFGMNSYPFYVTQPANFAAGPYAPWVADLAAFGSKRFYMDVSKCEDEANPDILRFQPSYEANWDKMLEQMPGCCISLTGNFKANRLTFPDPEGDPAKNAVWPLGVDRLSPEAYRKRGAFVYQFFARYGKVAVPTANLRTANGTTAHGWTGEEVHLQKTGLNYQFRLQACNEFFKNWKGPDAQGYGAQAAVFYAVCLDGYNNTMGPLVGARNADPSAEVEVQMLYAPDLVEITAFFDKLGSIYGYNADGSVKNAPRYMPCHWYVRDPKTDAGVSWEDSGLQADLNDLQLLLAVKAPGCQIGLDEYGYSYDPFADRSYVAPANGLTSEQRTCAFYLKQGFWNTRNDVANAHGYDMRRGQGPKPTGPGVFWDLTCDVFNTITMDAVRDVRTLSSGYLWAESLDQGSVLINRHTKAGAPDLYEVIGAGAFSIPKTGLTTYTKFVPTKGGWTGVPSAATGAITGTGAGEMPTYYRAG